VDVEWVTRYPGTAKPCSFLDRGKKTGHPELRWRLLRLECRKRMTVIPKSQSMDARGSAARCLHFSMVRFPATATAEEVGQ